MEPSKQEQQPANDAAWEKLNQELAGSESEDGPDTPIKDFFKRLIHGPEGMSKTDRAKGIGKSIAKGAAQFVNETEYTLAKGVKSLAHKAGLADDNKVSRQVPQADIDSVYGKHSDDPLAGFAEAATQFASGFATLGPLGAGTGVAARIGIAAAKGAVVDAVSFNPDDAGLAELLARAPEGYGVKELGEALSVNGDDNEAIKRAKRAAIGVIPGVALDAVVALSRMGWAKAVAKSTTATSAEKEVAQKISKESGEILAKIAANEHVPDGAFVTLKENPDGSFGIRPVNQEFKVELEPAKDVLDDAPRFKDSAEALQQIETINFGMNQRLQAARNAGGLTAEQADDLRVTFRSFLESADAGTNTKLTTGTHFNFSYYSEPDEVLAMIESVSEVFQKELDDAQIKGGVSQADQIKRIKQLTDGMDPDQARTAVTMMLERGSSIPIDVVTGAADVVMRDLGLQAAKLFDVVTARPHDAIAWEEARFAASALVRLQKALAGTNSAQARGLRFMQDRDAIAAAVPLQPKQNPARKPLKVAGPPSPDEMSAIRLREEKRMEIHPLRKQKEKPADLGVEKSPDEVVVTPRKEEPEPLLSKSEKDPEIKDSKTDKAVPQDIAGMTQSEVLTILKLAKMADGAPSKLAGIPGAATIIRETGFMRRAAEWFINFALSNPLTHATALTANMMVTAERGFARTIAGAVTANPKLMREGLDVMTGTLLGLKDGVATAAMAFRKGHSVISPGEIHQAFGGVPGRIIRAPSNALGAVDEFTRVVNYRGYVYAKALRFWRDKGLDGDALAKAVANDMSRAFDSRTGVAVIPDAMKFAEVPTMSADLGHGTLGGEVHSLFNRSIALKIVATPFIKTSVNIFRYTFDHTPALNMLAKRNREIWKRGGEELAILHTQTAMATALGAWALSEATAGNITGAGPKQPGLRKLWLQDHKPYSIKLNGEWRSYRRLDPIFTPLGIMADAFEISQEMGQEREADAESLIYTGIAGIAATFSNKSYMVGMTTMLEAWTARSEDKMERYLAGIGTTLTVPQLARALNQDPYLREVEGYFDSVKNSLPGLSETLPARYNLFGEPELRMPSMNPFPSRGEAKRTVASDLLSLGVGIMPMTRKTVNGVPVDLTDGDKFGRVDGLTPYEYAQKLLREPGDGEPSLKQALTDLVQTDEWKDASPGSEVYAGGSRFIMASRIIQSYRERAIGEMLDRFPLVEREIEMQHELKGASLAEGQKGALEVLREYGRK